MKNFSLFLGLAATLLSCQPATKNSMNTLYSPDRQLSVTVFLHDGFQPAYLVQKNGITLIDTSTLGFEFVGMPPIGLGMKILETRRRSLDETWEMPWGEQRFVRNHYNELTLFLQETASPNRLMNLVFRVFDDGLGFRIEFPSQEGLTEWIITDENTQFKLTGDHLAWWQPGDWDIYEHLYNTTRITKIDALSKRNHPDLAQTYIPENAVNTPVTMKTSEGFYLVFHEADLTDYADMTLKIDPANLLLQSELVGSGRKGYKVSRTLPFSTPWRTIQIAGKAVDLIESRLIENLCEPNRLSDIPWFKPMKYAGIWWEMHLGKSS